MASPVRNLVALVASLAIGACASISRSPSPVWHDEFDGPAGTSFDRVLEDYELHPHHLRLLQLAAECWDRSQDARAVIDAASLSSSDCTHTRRGWFGSIINSSSGMSSNVVLIESPLLAPVCRWKANSSPGAGIQERPDF